MIQRLLLSLSILLLVACGATESHDADEEGSKAGQSEANHKDGRDSDNGHNGHGEPHQLGKLSAFGREFQVVQMGEVHAGEEGAIELVFASGQERLTTARAWVGIASSEGSAKTKLDLEGKTNMHGHIDIPSPIQLGSKIWLSLEHDGKTETVSIAYK